MGFGWGGSVDDGCGVQVDVHGPWSMVHVLTHFWDDGHGLYYLVHVFHLIPKNMAAKKWMMDTMYALKINEYC